IRFPFNIEFIQSFPVERGADGTHGGLLVPHFILALGKIVNIRPRAKAYNRIITIRTIVRALVLEMVNQMIFLLS
ncbi:hypothetical protein, partial [Paenibacillus elgii]|uniref:hypothetical protein n=1 Tax=Paenibacillus elgii TaxID=189691 RepID=UPI0019548AA3